MPKVSEEYKKNRRSQIIDVARECFIKHGYQKTSMNDIIAATGLSAGAIYNHFTSKNEIMLEAARLDLAPFARVRAEKPWDCVLRYLKILDTAKTRRFLLATWGEAVSDPDIAAVVSEQLGAIRDMALTRYRDWGTRELDCSDDELQEWLNITGAAVLSVLTGYVVQAQLLGRQDRQVYLQYAAEVLAHRHALTSAS